MMISKAAFSKAAVNPDMGGNALNQAEFSETGEIIAVFHIATFQDRSIFATVSRDTDTSLSSSL